MRIIVAGVVRGGSKETCREIERLHELFTPFGTLEIFVVESDSRDDTPHLLQEFQNAHEWFSHDSLGNLAERIPERTERLAFCRNRYLDEVNRRGLEDHDLVVVADLDGVNSLLTHESIATALASKDWDVLTANQLGPYYDIWALRHPELSHNDYRKTADLYRRLGIGPLETALRALYSRMITISPASDRIAVTSAFGGLALYRPWTLRRAQYAGYDEAGQVVSEHVPFHKKLVSEGAKIFIQPSLVNTGKTEHSSLVRMALARLRRVRAKQNDQSPPSELAGGGRVGIVVPTLGTRPEYLRECLESIRSAGDCTIAIVKPASLQLDDEVLSLVDIEIDEPGGGVAAAINAAIRQMPADVEFVNWLGDDDRLTPESLQLAESHLRSSGAICVFGQCRYIDNRGEELWINRSGRYAVPLMRIGPQLIPQPGALFLRSAFENVGGLNEDLKWAFDLDLFLRLGRMGHLKYVQEVLAEFRWHADSLSVGGRLGSVTEASKVRVARHPTPIRQLSGLWEPALRRVILLAGERMNSRLRSATWWC